MSSWLCNYRIFHKMTEINISNNYVSIFFHISLLSYLYLSWSFVRNSILSQYEIVHDLYIHRVSNGLIENNISDNSVRIFLYNIVILQPRIDASCFPKNGRFMEKAGREGVGWNGTRHQRKEKQKCLIFCCVLTLLFYVNPQGDRQAKKVI